MNATIDIYPVIAVVVVILAAIIIWPQIHRSDLLRDSDPKDFAGVTDVAGRPLRRTYSLAMSQMIWWFLIILLSYLYVFSFNSHDPNHILTSQTLILMGIGAGTAIGAAMIEQSKKNTEKVTAFVALNKEI